MPSRHKYIKPNKPKAGNIYPWMHVTGLKISEVIAGVLYLENHKSYPHSFCRLRNIHTHHHQCRYLKCYRPPDHDSYPWYCLPLSSFNNHPFLLSPTGLLFQLVAAGTRLSIKWPDTYT